MNQMPRINLLPYRQLQQQANRQRSERGLMLALTAGILSLLVCVLVQHIDDDRQHQRLRLLQNEHQLLDQKIQQQTQLHKEIAQLDAELQELDHLLQQRSEIVRLLSELARYVPIGVRLNAIRQESDQRSLLGTAASHQDISYLLEKLQQTATLAGAQLQHTTQAGDRQEFLITVAARQQPATP